MRLARALTTDEQRIVTVLVIAGTERDPSDAAPTLVSPPVAPDDLDPTRRLAALLKRTGATLERFAGDAFAVILPPSGMPTDRSRPSGALGARALRRSSRTRNMALATGPRDFGRAAPIAAEGRAPPRSSIAPWRSLREGDVPKASARRGADLPRRDHGSAARRSLRGGARRSGLRALSASSKSNRRASAALASASHGRDTRRTPRPLRRSRP